MKQALYGWAYVSNLPKALQRFGQNWYPVKMISYGGDKYVRAQIGNVSFDLYHTSIYKDKPTRGRRWSYKRKFSRRDLRQLRYSPDLPKRPIDWLGNPLPFGQTSEQYFRSLFDINTIKFCINGRES